MSGKDELLNLGGALVYPERNGCASETLHRKGEVSEPVMMGESFANETKRSHVEPAYDMLKPATLPECLDETRARRALVPMSVDRAERVLDEGSELAVKRPVAILEKRPS